MRTLTVAPHPSEGLPIEDGTYVEPEVPAREFEAVLNPPTAFERRCEEARWAARSGPCVVLRRASREEVAA